MVIVKRILLRLKSLKWIGILAAFGCSQALPIENSDETIRAAAVEASLSAERAEKASKLTEEVLRENQTLIDEMKLLLKEVRDVRARCEAAQRAAGQPRRKLITRPSTPVPTSVTTPVSVSVSTTSTTIPSVLYSPSDAP